MVHYKRHVANLAGLVAVVLFARLGVWQLHRADEARQFDAAISAKAEARPVALDAAALDGAPGAFDWRAVEASGVWESRRQILLDNQISHGVAGYFVYTPLRLPRCDCAVLINRGWIPAGERRDVAPDLAVVAAPRAVRGVAAPPPPSGVGLRAGSGEALAAGILRVQRLDAGELSRWLGLRVAPFTVLLAPDEPDGYRRDWRPPDTHADRHLAYATQWFIFALIAGGLALWLNSSRR